MNMADKRFNRQSTGYRRIFETIQNETGASLIAAILFFVLCGVGASVILAASSASAGKMQKVPAADQKRFAVESAAAFLRDELKDTKNTIRITDVKVVDSRKNQPQYDPPVEYVYTSGTSLSDNNVLDSCVKQMYRSMEEEDKNASQKEETDHQTFLMSVQGELPKGTGTKNVDLDQLQAQVDLVMDSSYNITAVITDCQTPEDHAEDRCERKLTVSAKTQVDESEDVEEYEETDENGDVTKEWTITTITRVTTIYWERGNIQRTHPDTEHAGGGSDETT